MKQKLARGEILTLTWPRSSLNTRPGYIEQEKFLAEPGYFHVVHIHTHSEQLLGGKIFSLEVISYLSLYKTAQLDFSLNGFCFWLANPFIRKSSFPWSVQYFCRSLHACKIGRESYELDHDVLVFHLAHGDPVDGRLSSKLLNKLPLLLKLLHFSFVRKHFLQSIKRLSTFYPTMSWLSVWTWVSVVMKTLVSCCCWESG